MGLRVLGLKGATAACISWGETPGAMATPFQTEAWTEYGLGVVILFLRFFARWKTVGLKGWGGDDAFAILVLLFWTVGCITPSSFTLDADLDNQLELCMLELIGMQPASKGDGHRSHGQLTLDQDNMAPTSASQTMSAPP